MCIIRYWCAIAIRAHSRKRELKNLVTTPYGNGYPVFTLKKGNRMLSQIFKILCLSSIDTIIRGENFRNTISIQGEGRFISFFSYENWKKGRGDSRKPLNLQYFFFLFLTSHMGTDHKICDQEGQCV